MIARDDKTPARPDGLPPEAHNNEQDPTSEQAQDVADDAMRAGSHTTSPLESTKPDPDDYDPAPDSKPDLIDEMRHMESSGTIDMSAFAGEPNHDDEPGTYGGETTDDDDAGGSGEWTTADGEALNEVDSDDPLKDDDIEDLERILLDAGGEEEE